MERKYESTVTENSNRNTELEMIEIDLLLDAIYRYYGFDFRHYVKPSIHRRIAHRMKVEQLSSVSALQDKVLHDSACMERLFGDFSINVTEMFRDPSFFLTLRKKLVPILKEYPFIRIWQAGCSTGEEVYSMAILLHEDGLYERTTIYATDMNEKVLENAKKGHFPLGNMKQYTKNYIQSGGENSFSDYYTVRNNQVTFDPFFSENVVFAQHNLATDHSFNEFHVIICRNVLIYFDKFLQNQVHRLFYESLSPGGILGLGQKEGIRFTGLADCYKELDGHEKLFRKKE